MDIRARHWIDEAEEQAGRGNFAFAIWLVENAIEISSERDVRKLSRNTFGISEHELSDVALERNPLIKRLDRLLDHPSSLLPEEWLLIVSDLSSCYAVYRFIKRMPYSVAAPNLDTIVAKLEAVTDGFTLGPFRRQLDDARSRYPNPLPPPL